MGFFGKIVIFSAGIYTGIYTSQHYELSELDSPQEILSKLKDYLKQYEKKQVQQQQQSESIQVQQNKKDEN